MVNKKLTAAFGRAVFVVFFLCVSHLYAASGLTITEIDYDPEGSDTNREWVEVYNGGSSAIDLSSAFFLSDGLSSTHHSLAPQGSGSIAPGAYAVIVQNVDSFKKDYPTYAGVIIDSSWSGLTATAGKTIALIDAGGAVLDQVTYDPLIGGSNDGNSLQKNAGGTWIAAHPTPGALNATTGASAPADVSQTSTATTNETQIPGVGGAPAGSAPPAGTKIVIPPAPTKITAKISTPLSATVGIPIFIAPTVIGYSGETRNYGGFHYAFGDGTAYDGKNPDSTSHTYLRAGTYVVSFEYRGNFYQKNADATARATISVSVPGVIISSVAGDGSISIANEGETEADVSSWVIRSTVGNPSVLSYVIPSGTIILPKTIVVFPAESIGLLSRGNGAFEIALPSWKTSMAYSDAPVVEHVAYVPVTVAPGATVTSTPVSKPAEEASILAANALGAGESTLSTKRHSLLPFLAALLAVIGGAFFALRYSKLFPSKKEEGVEEQSEPSETKLIADEIRIVE